MTKRIPTLWRAGGPNTGWAWGFGYWCSGIKSLEPIQHQPYGQKQFREKVKDSLLCYHDLQNQSEKIREADLVKFQSSALKAILHWIKVRCSLGCVKNEPV